MTLRQRLEKSTVIAGVLAWLLASYTRLCFATTRWTVQGLDDLAEDIKNGPVVYVLWHSRVIFGASAWPGEIGQLFTMMDPSPIGRIASRVQAKLGMQPISMKAGASNFAASRKVLKVIRDGHSVGIAADGPQGPARQAKQAALEWARATGCPVYLFAWSARGSIRLKTWDRMVLPLPFSRGALIYRRWSVTVPRKLNNALYLQLRESLSMQLDTITAHSEKVANVSTGS